MYINTTEAIQILRASNSTLNVKNPFGGHVGQEATDALWMIITTFIIFTMQAGFGLLESGMVSRKSETNVMVKNILDVCIGGAMFWLVGYGLAFGKNSNNIAMAFTGNSDYALDVDVQRNADLYAKLVFQLCFSTNAATIISGAVAERIRLKSYMLFVAIYTGFIYSFPAHWLWGGGWLQQLGAYDFAGSSIVHVSGGAAAFTGALILGPRQGRFGDRDQYAMSSPTNVILGTFFLWWGWIGFNCGSTFAMSGGYWKVACKVAAVSMSGAIGGGLSGILMSMVKYYKRRYLIDVVELSCGILAGCVSITAAASVIKAWEALFIGFIGVIPLMELINIDDPVGCVGVHWSGGLWGMIATGLFAEKNIDFDLVMENGVFKGGHGTLLGYNLLAGLVVTFWSGICTFIVFSIIKHTLGIRMNSEDEAIGSDVIEHMIKEHNLNEVKHALGKHVVSTHALNNLQKFASSVA